MAVGGQRRGGLMVVGWPTGSGVTVVCGAAEKNGSRMWTRKRGGNKEREKEWVEKKSRMNISLFPSILNNMRSRFAKYFSN